MGSEGAEVLQESASSAQSSTMPGPPEKPVGAYELVEHWAKQVHPFRLDVISTSVWLTCTNQATLHDMEQVGV